MADLWDDTDIPSIPEPIEHATEGYWVAPSPITTTPAYHADDPGDPREAKILLGASYYNGATLLDQDGDYWTVEGGTFNLVRRGIYKCMNRLRRLNYLTCITPVESGDNLDGDAAILYIDENHFNATGAGTTTIVLTSGTPWSMTGTRDVPTCIVPGLIIQSGTKIAEITDVSFGNPNTTLTLDRPLRISGGTCHIKVVNALEPLPAPLLAVNPTDLRDPLQCRHAVKAEHSGFSSFASAFSASPMAAGINPPYFCAKMHTGADLSEFKASAGVPCNNTGCQFYQAVNRSGDMPNDQGYSEFFIGRGVYGVQPVAGIPVFFTGCDSIMGILGRIGMPFQNYSQAFGLAGGYKTYEGVGAIVRKGDVDPESGYDLYHDWLEDAAAGSDDVGLFGSIIDVAPTKRNGYDGGAEPYDFEKGVALRRVGVILPGPSGSVTGTTRSAQRPISRRYTSAKFDPTKAGTHASIFGETIVTVLSDPVTIEGETFNVMWRMPRYGETASQGASYEMKPSAAVSEYSIASGVMTVEFELSTNQAYFTVETIEGPVQATSEYQTGGNVVKPPLSWESYNPASLFTLGSRTAGLVKGDVLMFSDGPLAGLRLLCESAQAFGGSIDGTAGAPHVDAQGIPDILRTNHNRRDVATFRLPPGWLHDYIVDVIGTSGGALPPFVLLTAAVGPSQSTFKRVDSAKTVTSISTGYRHDPYRGVLYLDATGWDAGEYQLHSEGEVYDVLPRQSVVNVKAMDKAIDAVVANGWFQSSMGIPAAVRGVLVAEFEEYTERGDDLTGINLTCWPDGDLALSGGTPNAQYVELSPYEVVTSKMGVEWNIEGLAPTAGTLWYDWNHIGKLSINNKLYRLAPAWIAEAKVDIRITGMQVVKTWSTWEPDSVDPEPDEFGYIDMGSEVVSEPKISLTLTLGPDTVTTESPSDFVNVGSVNLASLKPVVVGEETWYQGSIDVTNILQKALERSIADDGQAIYVTMTVGGDAGNVTDALALASKFIETLDIRKNELDQIDRVEFVGYHMEFAAGGVAGMDRLMIRLDPDALTAGANYHFDSGGLAFGPDLGHI